MNTDLGKTTPIKKRGGRGMKKRPCIYHFTWSRGGGSTGQVRNQEDKDTVHEIKWGRVGTGNHQPCLKVILRVNWEGCSPICSLKISSPGHARFKKTGSLSFVVWIWLETQISTNRPPGWPEVNLWWGNGWGMMATQTEMSCSDPVPASATGVPMRPWQPGWTVCFTHGPVFTGNKQGRQCLQGGTESKCFQGRLWAMPSHRPSGSSLLRWPTPPTNPTTQAPTLRPGPEGITDGSCHPKKTEILF